MDSIKIIVAVFLSFVLISSSCRKEKIERIPNVPMNFSIPINSYQYNNLNTIGGYVYVTGGYRGNGLIIYRVNNEDFATYDRTCPYHPNAVDAKIDVESNGLFAIDSLCGSRFYLSDGSVNKGPATLPLKSYQTTFDGTYVSVYN